MKMTRICSRIFAVLTVFTLIVTMFAGCDNSPDNDASRSEELAAYVFIPEFTSLSALTSDLPNINNIVVTENTLHLTSTSVLESNSLFQTTRIFSVNLENSELTHLKDYSVAPPPSEAQGGGVYISSMQTDVSENLWIAETWMYVTFDFPLGFDVSGAEESEIWEHHKLLETSHTIRKLDATGKALLSIDIGHLASANDWFGLTSFYIDDEDNIFVGSGQNIIVLDIDGNTQFYLSTDDYITPNSFIRLSDSRVAHFSWSTRQAAATLQIIDTQNRAWGDTITLPVNVQSVHPGANEYLVIMDDGMNLTGIQEETGDIIQILNWMNSGVDPVGVANVLILSDERIMLTTTIMEYGSERQPSQRTELLILDKIAQNEVSEKSVITIASSSPHLISNAVTEFNRINSLYRVEIIEVEMRGSTIMEDIDGLALDIITGGGPDMIHTHFFPFHQWAGRGLFVDLYELIDSDPALNRSDFVVSVLDNTEINGRLYQIFPDFYINTLIGHPDIIGSRPGWSIDEFISVLDANPQATMPLGQWYGGGSLLNSIFVNDIDSFVNWDTATVYFDSDYFIELLEFTYILNTRLDFNWEEYDWDFQPEPFRMISSGEQIMESIVFSQFEEYSLFQDLFGGDFVFKGYPVEAGNGNSLNTHSGLAITVGSDNLQGSWEFIRMFISEGWQRQNVDSFFPTNKSVFDEKLAATMETVRSPDRTWNDLNTRIRPLAQEHIYNIQALVDSASGISSQIDPLWNIISESLPDFYDGKITAQDASRIIQNRASIFVSEQG